jgi:hypothetical protein
LKKFQGKKAEQPTDTSTPNETEQNTTAETSPNLSETVADTPEPTSAPVDQDPASKCPTKDVDHSIEMNKLKQLIEKLESEKDSMVKKKKKKKKKKNYPKIKNYI